MSLLEVLRFITAHPLNRGHRVAAVTRFARWQIRSRLVAKPMIHQWVNNARFLVQAGETGLTGNVYTGLHEFSDMAYLLHVLRREDLFVDVGANLGSYTILACAAVGARGFAFEPVRRTFQRLVENLALNELGDRVVCLNQGVGATPGELVFTTGSDTMNHALGPGETRDDTEQVAVTTLNDVLEHEFPALIKIDVEGYESAVLAGADRVLAKQSLHSVIVEMNGSGNRYGFDESGIMQLMTSHGFRPCCYSPMDRTLNCSAGSNPLSANTLFVRDQPHVMARLRNAPPAAVLGQLL